MAGASGALDTIRTTADQHWKIDYSRFFEFPGTSFHLKSTGLSPLLKSTISRFNGTWLSSSSPASLSLFLSYPLSEVALVVTLDGAVYVRGTFDFNFASSYRDRLGQVQKFALRFSTCNESQNFIDCIKESLKNSENNAALGVACQSERVTSGRIIYRGMMDGQNAEDTLALLPSSSTTFLSESCTEAREGFRKGHEVINFKSYSPRCLLDSSIHDVLYDMEKVIIELGGDLSI